MNKEQMTVLNRVVIGMILKAVRSEAGLQQIDAAARIGYNNATFVCSVEKGGSVIPADKIMTFAATYLPNERHELAAAIMKMSYPDYWNSSVDIISWVSGKNLDKQEINSKVDAWIKDAMEKYHIDLTPNQR